MKLGFAVIVLNAVETHSLTRYYGEAVCFSPEADLVGGLVVTAIGVDVLRHLKGRRDHLPLATLPVLLGVHQLTETFVWWGLEGQVPFTVGRVAVWTYLLIAFVVLPVFVPMSVLALEPTRRRRWRMAPFVAMGAVVAAVLLIAMVRGPVTASLRPYHIAYGLRLGYGGLVVVLYVVAVCGALLFSGYRDVLLFGLVNLVAIAVIARLTVDGFASVWCGYAALSAGAIALHMRYAKPHRANPYVLT